MKYIKTPTGEIFKKEDCIEFDDDFCNTEVFFHAKNQEDFAKELFEHTGILTAIQGGGDTG